MLLFKVCFIPYSHYVVDLIKKLELGIMVVSDLPKFVCPKLVYNVENSQYQPLHSILDCTQKYF